HAILTPSLHDALPISDAMPAHQAGTEIEEVPFAARRIEHVINRKPEIAEDHGHFVDEGDVDVALGVLDDLGGFGGADVGRAVDRSEEHTSELQSRFDL